MSLLVNIMQRAAKFDEEHGYSQALATSIRGVWGRAVENLEFTRSLLAKLNEAATWEGTTQAVARRVQSSVLLQHALTQAESLYAAVQEHPLLDSAKTSVGAAVTQLSNSITEVAKAPLTEKPVVAAHEAVQAARAAIQAVTEILGAAVDQFLELAPVAAARDRAQAVIERVLSYYEDAKEGSLAAGQNAVAELHTRAGSALDSAASLAGRLDGSLNVSERVKGAATAVDESLGVSAKAKALDETYGVSQKASAAADKLAELDQEYAGGKGAAAVQAASEAASSAAATYERERKAASPVESGEATAAAST